MSMKVSDSTEWPTLGLFIALYALWILLTTLIGAGAYWPYLFLWLLLTLHSSLQHETIHGHPTRSQTINSLIAAPGIGILLPFERFKELHLQHHRNASLTDPFDDTETYFMAQADWRQLSAWHQRLLTANNTLAGRLLLGPWIMYLRFYRSELAQFMRRNPAVINAWVKHAMGMLPVIVWLVWLDVSLLAYVLAVVWPATALLLLRSYTEHLPDADESSRTAVVISSKFMGLMFLNNNFHVVHHDSPGLPWFKIPYRYNTHYSDKTCDHVFSGYGFLIRKFAFKPRFPVAHPVLRTDTEKSAT